MSSNISPRSLDIVANDESSDEALMLRYSAGEVRAFDVLYARHRAGLFRFIQRQCSVKGGAKGSQMAE